MKPYIYELFINGEGNVTIKADSQIEMQDLVAEAKKRRNLAIPMMKEKTGFVEEYLKNLNGERYKFNIKHNGDFVFTRITHKTKNVAVSGIVIERDVILLENIEQFEKSVHEIIKTLNNKYIEAFIEEKNKKIQQMQEDIENIKDKIENAKLLIV